MAEGLSGVADVDPAEMIVVVGMQREKRSANVINFFTNIPLGRLLKIIL